MKKKYFDIGQIACPAFPNEMIRFDERGFNHLIMKNGKYRSKADQLRRLEQIHIIPNILYSHATFDMYKKVAEVSYWAFIQKTEMKMIKVIVRKILNGKLHFYSVMTKDLPKSTQAPEKGLL